MDEKQLEQKIAEYINLQQQHQALAYKYAGAAEALQIQLNVLKTKDNEQQNNSV